MNKRERNLLILLVVVALVTSPWWPIWGDGTETDELGLNQEARQRFASLSQSAMPELKLAELMEKEQPFTGASRNLFQYGSADNQFVEEEPEEDVFVEDAQADPLLVEEASTPAVDREPQPSAPRLAGYEFLGIFNQGEETFGAFQWRERVFVGRKGDVINDVFRIEEIDQDGADIFVLEGEYNQKLRLQQPAGTEGVF